MSDWSSGYVSDIGYTYGYYGELNPLKVKLAFLNKAWVYPEIKTACELGFGQGLSSNIHAAATTVDWYGTDFNPAQASFARELAEASGATAKLYDESFAEFCARDDLPEFDYIGLHGIWSWISDENRKIIVDFVRRKLRVGGILYISYNTLPGWSTFAPIRHLLTQHADTIGASGQGIVSRIDGALGFANALINTDPSYITANPNIGARLNTLNEQNRHYLAHEYFNRDWDPMYFSNMADWLQEAKIDFACSAHLAEHLDGINFSKEQNEFLAQIPDVKLNQSVRDFMINQQFRRDYWLKGARKLSDLERYEHFRELSIILCAHRAGVELKLKGPRGEATLSEEIYNPILDVLEKHKPISIGGLHARLANKGFDFSKIVEAIIILTGKGVVAEAQDASLVKQLKPRTKKLNDYLQNKAKSLGDITYLASPVTGGGVSVTRFDQLFISAIQNGERTPEALVEYVWKILTLQNQRLVVEGKTLESEKENRAHLSNLVQEFNETKLQILKDLHIL